jgi:hypothetical protein
MISLSLQAERVHGAKGGPIYDVTVAVLVKATRPGRVSEAEDCESVRPMHRAGPLPRRWRRPLTQ